MSHAFFAPNDTEIIGDTTVAHWKEKYKTANQMVVPAYSNYAGYAYDAVWTYALALDSLIKKDPDAASDLHSDNTTE